MNPATTSLLPTPAASISHAAPAEAALSKLRMLASPHPRTPPVLPTLSAAIVLLNHPSTPSHTVAALIASLCALPPRALPPSHACPLANAVCIAVLRTRAALSSLDLTHAATLVACLAARSDVAAAAVHSSRAAHRLIRASARPAAVNPPLREALRRLAVAAALTREECVAALHPPFFLSRASKLVAVAAPPRPFRILALDGGGTRAVLAAQVLCRIEELTGAPLRHSFDLIAGTSSGGVLAVATGLLAMSPRQCEQLYVRFAAQVLTTEKRPGMSASSSIYHAGKVLLFNKGMYNGRILNKLYEEHCGSGRLFEYAGGNGTPRVFALSTQIRSKDTSVRTPRPFLHANYRQVIAKGHQPRYAHGCMHRLSEALCATTAAPVYFDAFTDEDGEAFCDGGVVMNNPTSVAIHEAQRLWPDRPLGVVVSVGTGLFKGEGIGKKGNVTNETTKTLSPGLERATEKGLQREVVHGKEAKEWRGRMALRVAQAVLESATDTEGVHHTLEDLLGNKGVYFRLNVEVEGEQIHLDEYRADVLQELIKAGRAYVAKDGPAGALVARLAKKLMTLGRPSMYGLWRTKGVWSHSRL